MPYNTRRKSLSLSELGITVPKRSRAASHPSPPSTIVEGEDEPPVKRSKRSHDSKAPSSGLMSPPRTTVIRTKDVKAAKPISELSPPPSPAVEGSNKVDVEGISDDIVVGTIQQLEKTGNRPHLVKELAHVLSTSLTSIEKSANPCALISSRLTAYLHRTWPAISPCPLAKDLSPVHPRRLYFYLTTTPHQPIPEVADPLPKPHRIISPSLSSASAADEEERYNRRRTQMSPSPEVDLSSPELEEESVDRPPTSSGSFSARNSMPRDSRASSLSQHRRAASPQLEREERDFKQTANQAYEEAQQRRRSGQQDINMDQAADAVAGTEASESASVSMSIEAEETEESVALKSSDDVAALFGQAEHLVIPAAPHLMDFGSPVVQPLDGMRLETTQSVPSPVKQEEKYDKPMESAYPRLETREDAKLMFPEPTFAWESLQSPENVELDELENMFDAY